MYYVTKTSALGLSVVYATGTPSWAPGIVVLAGPFRTEHVAQLALERVAFRAARTSAVLVLLIVVVGWACASLFEYATASEPEPSAAYTECMAKNWTDHRYYDQIPLTVRCRRAP